MVRPRIGLALGSGAARGWSHIGVIEALTEADIEPDIVCGCSIGALVGAAYVAGELSALKQFAQSLTWREIARMLDVRLSGGGLIAGQEIVALLRKLKISASIASYRKPFAAVATDLQTGREIWLRDGPIEEAVRASISLPGILSPARHADRWLVDGGLVNPVPVSVCRAIGADVVIAVNLNGDLVGRHGVDYYDSDARSATSTPPEFLTRLVDQMPTTLREQASAILPKLVSPAPTSPGWHDHRHFYQHSSSQKARRAVLVAVGVNVEVGSPILYDAKARIEPVHFCDIDVLPGVAHCIGKGLELMLLKHGRLLGLGLPCRNPTALSAALGSLLSANMASLPARAAICGGSFPSPCPWQARR